MPTSTARGQPKKGRAGPRTQPGRADDQDARYLHALGNPTGCFLTPGQAHDLAGADVLLPQIAADTILADKAYDADKRGLEPLAAAGKTAVMPPKSHRTPLRQYDKELYQSRHWLENFCLKLKQYRAIATRYDKTDQNFLAAIYTAATIILLN